MKTYHFLAGLPRSGNTLLSSILNQNPNIYSSPLSPINGMLWDYDQGLMRSENFLKLSDAQPALNAGSNIIKNYYSNINKPIIIDREKVWGTPANLNIIKKYITPTPKIIFTVRPVVEILASFINILSEDSYIDTSMRNDGWWYKNYLSKNDNRCDYLMSPGGQIDKALFSINEIINSDNKNVFHIISYDEIVNEPENTLKGIYKFLKLPSYKHNFGNIVKLEKDNDEIVGLPTNLHEIRPKLSKVSKKPEDVLSDYVLNKYSNIGWGAL
jgi:sulfotransferase